MNLLDVKNLRVEYSTSSGPLQAVDGASFSIPEGAIVGLVGESGCGKTTAAKALTGVMPKNATVTADSMDFDGHELLNLSRGGRNELHWRDISFVPQSAMNSLDPVYRIKSQLGEVLRRRGGLSKRAAKARSEELFDMVGIDPARLNDFPHQFSGGMRQRVAIALALALSPRLVIADEPVTALDVIVQRQILDQIRELRDRLGISMVMVTHDISVVAYACDYVVVMYAGKVIEAGPVHEVLTAPGHPYTMGLNNAFPDILSGTTELTSIRGYPPDLHRPPKGCGFEARCPFAMAECSDTQPILQDLPGSDATSHIAGCLRLNDVTELRAKAKESATWSL